MSLKTNPVWITGKCTKRTRRAYTVHALSRGDNVRVATLPAQYIFNEQKLSGVEEYKYLVPEWLAFQNKLVFVKAESHQITELSVGFKRMMFDGEAEPPSNSAQIKEEIMDSKVTPQNYAALAMRTAKLMDTRAMLLHGVLGILTEVGELSEAIFKPKEYGYSLKELGDICWFAAYTNSAFLNPGLHFNPDKADVLKYVRDYTDIYLDFPKLCNILSVFAADIGSNIKAHTFYGKPLNVQSLHGDLQALIYVVSAVSTELGFTMEEILQANIDKLRQRYPENFTEEDALSRKDEIGGATTAYTNQDQGA